MWVPKIKMSPNSIYQREIDKYKKQGGDYTFYYKVGLISLKSLTDNDIDRIIDEYSNKKLSRISSYKFKARHEIILHYKIVRRQEKILKIKNKYQKKENFFKRLFKWKNRTLINWKKNAI